MPERFGLYGLSSAELREMTIDWALLPALRALVRERPETTDILVCMAQYYNDDATDEVHVLPLLLERPLDPLRWPPDPPDALLSARRAAEAERYGALFEEVAEALEPEIRLRASREWMWHEAGRLRQVITRLYRRRGAFQLALGPAFAPCCKPGMTQHEPWTASFAPILHVGLPAWTVRWIGERLQFRLWADGRMGVRNENLW